MLPEKVKGSELNNDFKKKKDKWKAFKQAKV